MLCIGEKTPKKCFFNGKELSKIYLGNTLLWYKLRRLPDGYTELEYIKVPDDVTNAAYCPRLLIPATAGATNLEVTALHNYSSTSAYGAYIYSYFSGATATATAYGVGITYASSSMRFAIRQGTYNGSTSLDTTIPFGLGEIYTLRIYPQLKRIYINGTSHTYTAGTTSTNAVANALYFFYNPTYPTVTLVPRTMRLYGAKWYNSSGNVLRELVPARDSKGTLGMYDITNNVFYTDANTSTSSSKRNFEAGPAV